MRLIDLIIVILLAFLATVGVLTLSQVYSKPVEIKTVVTEKVVPVTVPPATVSGKLKIK